ncbi:MAG: AMP-binding protein [Rhodospirillales bacterium]|jgi:malonyl-CoA/methylmalonyl-CoA synthetase|nr:AMP-binding protein [Rhodospirillales bacterium]
MTGNVYEAFRQRFPADRSRPFIESGEGTIHTYRDLEETCGRYARLLRRLGVGKGDRVAGQVEKSAEAVFLYLAVLRAGAIYMPLTTAYRKAEMEYFLSDAEPKVVVGDPGTEGMVGEIATRTGVPHVLTLDGAGAGSLTDRSLGLDIEFPTVAAADEDVCAIVYTSGTTGRPKGAMMTHGLTAWNAKTLHRAWGWRPDDVLLHTNPISHGLFGTTNLVLMNGTGMIFLPKFDAQAVTRLLPRATVFIGVPTYYVRLLADPGFTAEVCRGMRLFVTGSAPLRAETFHAFRARTGHTLLDRYGLTETLLFTSNPLDGERIPDTSGPPLPGVEVRITDAGGDSLPEGEIGMIEVKMPHMFKGYWGMAEKTAADFRRDGFFITGDQGRINPNGYVSVVGRAKDVVISGGFNVYPKEVETCIDAIDGVEESAVIGVPHPDFGEAVAAVVTRRGDGVTEDGIIGHLKGEIANYKVAKRVFFVDDLPRNALGKVEKKVLRERYQDTFKTGGDP